MNLVGFIIRIYHDARSPERQKLILRFVKHQKNRLLKNFPSNIIKIVGAISISRLFRRWTIVWIKITQMHTLDSTELFYETINWGKGEECTG